MKNKIKIPEKIFLEIKKDIEKHKPNETILFLLAARVLVKEVCFYLVTKTILLDYSEAVRKKFGVEPTEEFSRSFYTLLKKFNVIAGKNRLITVHSHPFCAGKVSMSGIDDATMNSDLKVYAQIFGRESEFLSVVFNANLTDYDGYVVSTPGRQLIEKIAVIGSGISKIGQQDAEKACESEIYSRTKLIPGFDLTKAIKLKIGVVGAGGLGSCIITALTLEGFAENEELVIVDPDRIELSNLARIPYAVKRDIGRQKAEVAKEYVKRLRPERKVVVENEECFSTKSQEALATCDVIISCVDSELARLSINHLASNFMIPLIDLGSSVVVDELFDRKFVAQTGQARIFVPGTTSCLLCNMGIDSIRVNNELARKFMTAKEKKLLEKTGYLQNLTNLELPQPSVYSLNSMISTIGMSVLKKFVFDGRIEHNWINANFGTATILKENRKSNENCPVCGKNSTIGEGRFFDIHELIAENKDVPEPSFEKTGNIVGKTIEIRNSEHIDIVI